MRRILFIWCFMLFCGTLAAATEADDARSKRLDATLDRALSEGRIVGAVLLVAKDGKIVYHRAAGMADRETARPMREDAIFYLTSVSKVFTSAAAVALAEQGKLDLDAPVSRYLPGFRPALPDGSRPEIAVRQLLNHTAGLNYSFFETPDGPYHRLNVSNGFDQPGLTLEENLKRLAAAPLLFAPGTGWRYSMATDALGGVMEKSAGKTLPEIIDETVAKPLGLQDAAFAVKDKNRLVTPYMDAPGKPARMAEEQKIPFAQSYLIFNQKRFQDARSYPSGGAGMAASAGDIMKLLEAIRMGGSPLISSKGAAWLTADTLAGIKTEGPSPGWSFSNCGAVLRDPVAAKTPQAQGTFAWGGVYGHSWFVDPVNRITVVLLTNTAIEGMAGKLPTDIRDAVYAK